MENLIVEGRCRATGDVVAVNLSTTELIEGVEFDGLDFSKQNLDGLCFDGCRFIKCRFLKTSMDTRLCNSTFDRCEMELSEIKGGVISCEFLSCSLSYSDITATILSTRFKACMFYRADLKCDWGDSTIEDCQLRGAIIHNTKSLTIKDCTDPELATACLNLSVNAIPDADDNLISFLAEMVVKMAHKSTDANAKRWLTSELISLVALRKPNIKNQLGLRF